MDTRAKVLAPRTPFAPARERASQGASQSGESVSLWSDHALLQRVLEMTRAVQEAQLERDTAKETSAAMELSLAKVAHELRTPLSAVTWWVQLARRHVLTPAEVAHALDVIERNSVLQSRLVDDLIDYHRASSGKLTVSFAEVQLADVVRAALDSLLPQAQQRQLSVVTDLAPVTVHGDFMRLLQILVNLVMNAIKFSKDEGSIAVTLKRSGDSALLSVSDTGPGLSREEIANVFEPFWQGSHGLDTRGLGLGLSIVRTLTQLHGGQVRVHTEGLGKGCTFEVELPLQSPRSRSGTPCSHSN